MTVTDAMVEAALAAWTGMIEKRPTWQQQSMHQTISAALGAAGRG